MASVAATYTFSANTVAASAEVNQNFTDLVNYTNNRNSGSATWDAVYISSATSDPVLKVNNSTGTNTIVQFQDNGTNVFSIADGGIITATGVYRGPAGANTAPAFSFSTDTNSGIYSSGADEVAIACGGTRKMYVTATQLLNSNDGTNSAPGYTWSSDTNTGIYLNGADDIAIGTGGSRRMGISDSAIICSVNHRPTSDNAVSSGVSGGRWTEVWAANGTIQTSMSETKENIRDMEPAECKVPRPVYFSRPGKTEVRLGWLADNLPEEAHPMINEVTGERSAEDIYTDSAIAMLALALRNDFDEIAKLKDRLTALEAK